MGIELRGVYDGVVVWIEADGSMTNRFAGIPGLERRAAAAQAWIEAHQCPDDASSACETSANPTTPES